MFIFFLFFFFFEMQIFRNEIVEKNQIKMKIKDKPFTRPRPQSSRRGRRFPSKKEKKKKTEKQQQQRKKTQQQQRKKKQGP